MLKVTRTYHAHTITIDDEPVDLRIARLDLNAFADFSIAFEQHGRQAERPPLAEDATPAQIEARAKLEAAEEAEARAFMVDSITNYITVAPAQIQDEDGQEITAGADLLRLYGGRFDILRSLLAGIWITHKLSPSQKKAWRSRRDSGASSAALPLGPDGASPTPETAAPVAIEDGIGNGTVPAPQDTGSSGPTEG